MRRALLIAALLSSAATSAIIAIASLPFRLMWATLALAIQSDARSRGLELDASLDMHDDDDPGEDVDL